MKADYKELGRNLLALSMAAAMLFQFQTQAATTADSTETGRAGDGSQTGGVLTLDGVAKLVTSRSTDALTGSLTLTLDSQDGLGTAVFTPEADAVTAAAAIAQTTDAAQGETDDTAADTAEAKTEETDEADDAADEADETAEEETPAPVESADVATEDTAAADTTAAEADTTEAAADTTEATTDTTEAAVDTTEAEADTASSDTDTAAAEPAADPNESTRNQTWTGQVLNSYVGAVYGPSGGKEVYYNMNMSQVVANLKSAGYEGDYWVRDDGVKMFGNYVMVAACYSVHPYGSFVETTLGTAIVCDTGTFAYSYPNMLDVAVTW